MRHFITAAALALSTIAAGCSTTVESACNKAEECGELGDQSLEQCIANLNKSVDDLRKKEKEACDKIADAAEAFYDCAAGLSCEELKKDASATDCKQAQTDVNAAITANAEACGLDK